MKSREAEDRFRRADELFKLQLFDEALDALNALDLEFPDNHRILNAKARTLKRLGHNQAALDIYHRLVKEFGYDKAREPRDRLVRLLDHSSSDFTPDPFESEQSFEFIEDEAEPSLLSRIKPIRLLLLVAVLAAAALQFIPYWLAAALVAGYFAIKYLIRIILYRLFTVPFKMKGKALDGATVIVHGYEWTTKPETEDSADFDEAEPAGPRRYVWIEVTITPPNRQEGFTHWEPGELAVAPLATHVRNLDDHDKCYAVRDVRLLHVDGEEEEDEGYKLQGRHRIKVLAAVPAGESRFKFVYYLESFGDIRLGA